jgi:hypothetical protein
MRLPGNAVPANLRPAETTTSMVKCSPNAELDVGPTQTDRGRVKTLKYSVFGCRFTLPESPRGPYAAI